MYTFPGGVYEDSDKNLKVTAMREIFEEAGAILYPQNQNNNKNVNLSEWRKIIRSDPSKFYDLMSILNLPIDQSQQQQQQQQQQSCPNFYHHCTFVTPNFEKRRYTTLFFIGELHESDSQHLEADGTETSSLIWIDPLSALESNRQGNMIFLPPQYYILSELSQHQSIESIFSQLNQSSSSSPSPSKSKLNENDTSYHPENVYNLIDSRGYPPFKPAPLLSNETKMILTLPFDEAHPDHPGKTGNLHRIHCTLPMGEGGYELEKTV